MASSSVKYLEVKGSLWPADREPFHGDIIQGRLGNCFFIAALQAIASCQPGILKSIVKTLSTDHQYRCVFYRQGELCEIDVDLTNVPIDSHTNVPIYCRSTSEGVIWPYVFEKAYSQFYGSYDNLLGGNTSEAFYDLLGLPVEEYDLTDETWGIISNSLNKKEVFVTCGSIDTSVQVSTIRSGIRINHAYVILATSVFQAQRYVVIHNPQNIKDIQTENTRVKKAFFHSGSNRLWENQQGTQFLAWKDLTKICNRIQICYHSANSILSKPLYSEWTEISAGGCSNFHSFYLNPFILLPYDLNGKRVTILIGQNDQRCERDNPLMKLNYPQLGITVVKLKKQSNEDPRTFIPTHDRYEAIKQSKFWNKRDVALHFSMPANYNVNTTSIAVVLSTYSPQLITKFWLQLYLNTKINTPIPCNIRTISTCYSEQQSFIGEWNKANAGGRYQKNTFHLNPCYRILVENVQESSLSTLNLILYQIPNVKNKNTQITPLQSHHPIGLYIFSLKDTVEIFSDAQFIRARSISKTVQIHTGHEYYVVPACFDANLQASYGLHILSDVCLSITKIDSIGNILKNSVQKSPPPIVLDNAKRNVKRLVFDDYNQSVSVEALLDAFIVLYDECCNSTLRREKTISEFIDHAKSFVSRVKKCRLNRDDFETIKIIGRGAFGEVAVVRTKKTDRVYAMKTLNKWEMLKRADTACFKEERDVLVFGDPHWLTKLYYAFQDSENLYFIMDYYFGGDLLTLLSKFNDHFSEEMTRFYVAEMVLAIDSLHKLGYVHRDIKPDNILLDGQGHIRLADFGSCLRMRADGTVKSNVAVGTPDYISPEILRAMEQGQGRYGAECDWWSLGCAMWEMLFGLPPFYAESLLETYGKIMMHVQKELPLPFPSDIDVSDSAKDLLKYLLCASEQRLGKNGLDDFKNHPFFQSIVWNNIRQSIAPYIPVVSSPIDTSNFDVDDIEPSSKDTVAPVSHAAFTGHHLPFIGFTFSSNNRFSDGVHKLSSSTLSSVIQVLPPTVPIVAKDVCDSSSDNLTSTIQSYEETIASLQCQQTSLLDELKRLREVYEQTKSDTIEQSRQTKLLKDYYENEVDSLTSQQCDYYFKILNIFNHLRQISPTSVSSSQNLNELQMKIREHLTYFDENHNQTLNINQQQSNNFINNDTSKRKLLNNDKLFLDSLLKFELKFQRLFQNMNKTKNGIDDDPSIEDESDDDSEECDGVESDEESVIIGNEQQIIDGTDLSTKKLNKVMKYVYKKLKLLLREKYDAEEKLNIFEEKHSSYTKWETQVYDILKWISEEKTARTHLKGLASKMAEELDTIRETGCLTSPLTSSSSAGHNTSWKHGRSVKLKHMEIQQLQTSIQKEIEAKQKIHEELKDCQAENILKVQENQQLRQEIEKLQHDVNHFKHLYENSIDHRTPNSNTTLSVALRSPGSLDARDNISPDIFMDNQSFNINNTSFDRFLRSATTGLSESRHDELSTISDGDNGDNVDDIVQTNVPVQTMTSILKPLSPLKNEYHDFHIANFHVTVTCDECQNALIGLIRQGFVCQRCKYICHPECMGKITMPCRPTLKERNRSTVADHHIIRVPKAGGIKKGWMKHQLLILQTKLLFYELSPEKDNKITWAQPSFILDLTDEEFHVSTVSSSDAFHANKKDIASIFKISVLKLVSPKHLYQTLILTNNETEKTQYINMLSNLSAKVKAIKQNTGFIAKEFFDTSRCTGLKESPAAAILDSDHVFVCGEDGLYLINIAKDSCHKLSDKKVYQISIVNELNLLLTLSGRQRTIRCQPLKQLVEPFLHPHHPHNTHQHHYHHHHHQISSLSTVEGCKIQETKNCTTFAVSKPTTNNGQAILCVSIKNRILIYQIFQQRPFHSLLKEFNIVHPVQYLEINQDKLYYGYPSTFVMQKINTTIDGTNISLLRDEDPTLQFVRDRPIETLRVIPVSNNNNTSTVNNNIELLLVFRELGIYVNQMGIRTRHRELMWSTAPVSTAYKEPFLMIFTDRSIDIYDVPSATWVQTIPLQRTKPLTNDGSILITNDPDIKNDAAKLLYFVQRSHLHSSPSSKISTTIILNVPDKSKSISNSTKRFRVPSRLLSDQSSNIHQRLNAPQISQITTSMITSGNDGGSQENVKSLISGPKDFTHISHLGKGEGLQIISGLKQISPSNTLINSSQSNSLNSSYGGSGNTLNTQQQNLFASNGSVSLNHRRSVISGPVNFVHLTHIGPSDITTFSSDLSTTNTSTSKAIISAPMNFRHQVHIGPSTSNDETRKEQQTNSNIMKQYAVGSGGNTSTLSSRSISLQDDEEDDEEEVDENNENSSIKENRFILNNSNDENGKNRKNQSYS
ncbi:unnamed protein product [Didymodactylos carnosus]|uniref:non-specific serine/threonine protein kinase n=1 Tax=Didymodactylos carnosus TaxID=1234261 RepID=A0A8S2CRH8_9BILA|nr:unnamed protein product [Didymodactylos carnosus]CAF3566457.1 unnamed protein product [Didymodactylos carnosus]